MEGGSGRGDGGLPGVSGTAAGSLPAQESAVNPQQPRDGSRNMETSEWTNALSYDYNEKVFCRDEATAKHNPTGTTFLRQAGSRKIVFPSEIQ